LILVLWAVFPVQAADDLGNGACQQTTGEVGLWNGTTADDEGCITPTEYAVMYQSDDGEDPLDQIVSVDPEQYPGPTVREVFEDPFVRAQLSGLTIE